MVRYGLTPVQAIQTATQNPAKVFDLTDTTGELKAGLQADILVVEGDVTSVKKCPACVSIRSRDVKIRPISKGVPLKRFDQASVLKEEHFSDRGLRLVT